MGFPEQSRVIFKCPVCERDIVERTTNPEPGQVQFVLEHASVEPACRWFLETLMVERERILRKLVEKTTSELPEGGV